MDIYTGVITIFFVLLIAYYLGVFRGAPFLPTDKETIERMITTAEIKPDEKLADLGSGDGRIVMAAARAGAEAHGYEINPLLIAISRWRIKRAGLENKAFIHWKNFWLDDFSRYNIVTVYGITRIMAKLEEKLQKELPSGARVISNTFNFPNWVGMKTKNTYKYIKL